MKKLLDFINNFSTLKLSFTNLWFFNFLKKIFSRCKICLKRYKTKLKKYTKTINTHGHSYIKSLRFKYSKTRVESGLGSQVNQDIRVVRQQSPFFFSSRAGVQSPKSLVHEHPEYLARGSQARAFVPHAWVKSSTPRCTWTTTRSSSGKLW